MVMQMACSKEPVCLRYANISAGIVFKKNIDTLPLIDTVLPHLIMAFDSFYLSNKEVSESRFLVKSTVDSMQIIITPDSGIAKWDTINLYYNRQLNFINKECGYNYYYQLKNVSYSTNSIKNISIINNQVNNDANAKHLQVNY
jgi:hypothetical protein